MCLFLHPRVLVVQLKNVFGPRFRRLRVAGSGLEQSTRTLEDMAASQSNVASRLNALTAWRGNGRTDPFQKAWTFATIAPAGTTRAASIRLTCFSARVLKICATRRRKAKSKAPNKR